MKNQDRHIIPVNGIELHYEKYGQGDPLLLLHGWTQSSMFWWPYIADLKKDFEVYAVDLRGHGRSTPLSGDFSLKKAACDIEEMVRKLDLRSVNAIGLSYGGLLLLELAVSAPAVFRNLVVIGTSFRYNGKEAQKGKPAFNYEGIDPSFKDHLLQLHVHGEQQVRSLFDPYLDYSIYLTDEQLKSIRANVLIVHGEHDDIAPLSQATEMAALIPRSELWVVPGAGHLAISTENKEVFVRKAREFIL